MKPQPVFETLFQLCIMYFLAIPIVYMYPSFFIHSSVDGHLDCFHVLAIVNSAAMNIGEYVFFSFGFFRVYA